MFRGAGRCYILYKGRVQRVRLSEHILREGFRFHVICCQFSANLVEGPYTVVFDAIKLAIVLRNAFNPRFV